jgi:lysophospholipase L1-like esterase
MHARRAKIAIVGTSHVRRLQDAISLGKDESFQLNFGIVQADVSYVCQGGWKLQDVRDSQSQVDGLKPDYLIIKVGSNDLCDVNVVDSIKVANDLIDLTKHLCASSGAGGAIVCEFTQRQPGRFLPSPELAEDYNRKVTLANRFLKDVIHELEPELNFWPHKGMTESVSHLLCPDGTHVNASGQFLLYKSLRGAVIYAAKRAGFNPPQ